MKNLLNKIKELSYRIYASCIIFVSSLYAMPTFVYADGEGADLTNVSIDSSGKLVVPGASSSNGVEGTVSAFTKIMNVARTVVSGITGLISIALIAVLAMKAFQLSKCGDNPSERAKVTQGIIWYFIAVVIFGATSLLTGVFYNMLH